MMMNGILFYNGGGSCDHKVEYDVEELEGICTILDGDGYECMCCDILFFVDIFDIDYNNVIEDDKEKLEELGLIFDLLGLFTFSSDDEVEDDEEELEDW